MYLVGFSCFYQGKITQKGAEWSKEERESGKEGKSERSSRERKKKREGIIGGKNLVK